MTDRTHAIAYETIVQLAEEAGLPEIGVTDASAFAELVPVLQAYEARGRTGFESGTIEERVSPHLLLDGAKSIIVATLPYLTPESRSAMRQHPVGRTYGSVSVYAYGVDYHTVLHERLDALRKRIEETTGRRLRVKFAIDTSPLVDRRVAERAGIGWIGKNGLLYSRRYGSYVFIGSMITDLEISGAASKPMDVGAHCDSCQRCILACPTGAILAPGVIDATRCLSYVTQMKGMIPLEFRKLMGRRIWGCDVCQTSCPENRRAELSMVDLFRPEDELAYPELIGILALSGRQFERTYGHTALAWRGLRTLQRNALIILGNIGKAESLPHIAPFLGHARPELRASAAWACGEIGGNEARTLLRNSLETEQEQWVRDEMERGLMRCEERRDRQNGSDC